MRVARERVRRYRKWARQLHMIKEGSEQSPNGAARTASKRGVLCGLAGRDNERSAAAALPLGSDAWTREDGNGLCPINHRCRVPSAGHVDACPRCYTNYP